jgi:ketosteroid isomerase-like protein
MNRSSSRHLFLLPAIVIAVLLAACVQPASDTGLPLTADLKHSWEENFNRGDVAAVVALYAPDARLLMSGSPPVEGAASIRHALEDMARSGVEVRIGADSLESRGDAAYVYGKYSVLTRAGGKEIDHGEYVEIWRRLEGVWKITLDINVSLPAASGAPPQANARQ